MGRRGCRERRQQASPCKARADRRLASGRCPIARRQHERPLEQQSSRCQAGPRLPPVPTFWASSIL